MTLLLSAALALGGCATIDQLDSDVSTFSQWPAGRKPAGYAFERLPSQQARAEQQQTLEGAARRAIEAAGFTLEPDLNAAEFSIQVGARVAPNERAFYGDPFWWHGGLYGPRRRSYYSPYWGFNLAAPSYEREVAVLIRDRKTGQTLYEARATSDGASSASSTQLAAMFEAALKDFPNTGLNPRRVRVELGP
jgi:hypothetical protein